MRTPVTKLTNQLAYTLAGGDYLLFADQLGLLLKAGYGEPKSRAYTWYWQHRAVDGKLRRLKLGRWPAMSVIAASAARENRDRERQEGTNHVAEKQAAKVATAKARATKQLQDYSTEDLADDYLRYLEKTRKPKAVYDVRLVLKPIMLDEPAADWTRSRAAALLHKIAARAPSMARTLRQEMSRAWDYAVSTGRLSESLVNPWAALKNDASLKPLLKAGRGNRYFSDAEIATFLAWLPTSPLSPAVRDALALTLMLGARSGEVVAMNSADIDLEGGTWSIKDTKTDVPRTVRLPQQALAILKGRLQGKWVFPSPNGKHLRQHALVWAIVKHRKASGLADWSAHDLRRTCRTGLSRLGVSFEVAETVLGHTRGGVAGIYDLHKFEEEAGKALQLWCNHIEALQAPSVVVLPKRQQS